MSILSVSLPEFISVVDDVYVADTRNHVIRKITVSTGNITTIAGNGTYGYTGDGGPATSATLYNPVGIAIDSSGSRTLLFDFIPDYTVRSSI